MKLLLFLRQCHLITGALWNYKTITEDRSKGVHNPNFAKSILQIGIDAIK